MDWRDKLGFPEDSIESLDLMRELPIEIIEQMISQKLTGAVTTGDNADGQLTWFEIQFEDFALAITLDCDSKRPSMKFYARRKDGKIYDINTSDVIS